MVPRRGRRVLTGLRRQAWSTSLALREVPQRIETQTLNLALQGGGAHGVFTWGVLGRLLEEPRVLFQEISGASACAINGVLLAAGLVENGPTGDATPATAALPDGSRLVPD